MKRGGKAGSSSEPFGEEDRGDLDEESPLLDGPAKPQTLLVTAKDGCGLGAYMQRLEVSFGHELLLMLFVAQHLMKGFVNEFIAPCIAYLYGSYKVPGPQMQIYRGVTQLPWAMKPMIGLLSDAVPIFGYNKSPYILLVAVLGAAAMTCIGSVPRDRLGITSLVLCIFLIQLQLSTTDLLTEAKYAEKMQTKPKEGPALMSFVWFGLQVGGLVATLLIGPIMASFGPKLPFLVTLVPASIVIVPVLRGYMQERRLSSQEVQAARADILRQKEACILCFLMLAATLVLSFFGTMLRDVRANAIASIVIAAVILLAFSVLLRPEIAKVNTFFVLQTSVNFSVGPHFSMVFYTTALGVAGSICSLIGIYTYQKYASEWTFRQLLLVSNIAICILSISDVIFFLRLNVRMGIPDHAFILGSNVFASILSQWQWMPGVVILSQLCPPGLEATMYALLAGCHNLGGTIASATGAYVLQVLEVQPSGAKDESAQFQNLWVCAALSSILPAFVLLLLPWLIPDRKQTDKLLHEGDVSVTEGSIWHRFMGQDA
ncbi:Probable folate-biopterin transporter 3 [Durusdinium trenchii]|uniref:Probable folate-biopterin transporter 3 n=1 Tax=Durusdinium trenchii TaxID=1381693 RepID=A0ABP0IJU7_9DINO